MRCLHPEDPKLCQTPSKGIAGGFYWGQNADSGLPSLKRPKIKQQQHPRGNWTAKTFSVLVEPVFLLLVGLIKVGQRP